MNEFENKNPEEMDEEVPENYITLTDDEGNDISFEIIGTVDYEGHLYAVMIPFDDEDDEVVILEIIPTENPDESEFLSVDDDDLLGEIFVDFKNTSQNVLHIHYRMRGRTALHGNNHRYCAQIRGTLRKKRQGCEIYPFTRS